MWVIRYDAVMGQILAETDCFGCFMVTDTTYRVAIEDGGPVIAILG